ncbi:hypothetical protein IFR05_002557 [Cadophora sp. M221]|nr:hypothetical protein IFR05_002557 [Cadophora sp. M221]
MSFRHSFHNLIISTYLLTFAFLAFQLTLHNRDQPGNRATTRVGIKSDFDASRKAILVTTDERDVFEYLPGDAGHVFTFPVEKSSLVSLGLGLVKERQEEQLSSIDNDVQVNSWEPEPRRTPSASEKSKLGGSSIIEFPSESLHSFLANNFTASSSTNHGHFTVSTGFWIDFNRRSTSACYLRANPDLIGYRVNCTTCAFILSLFIISVCLSSFLGIYFAAVLLYPLGDSFTLAAYVLAVGAFAWSAFMAWHSPRCKVEKRGGAGVGDGELPVGSRAC